MSEPFFEQPILNSPYTYPDRHWELDETGQPTNSILSFRRGAEFVSPVPKPKVQKGAPVQAHQMGMTFSEGFIDAADGFQEYNPSSFINGVRQQVDAWRALPNPADWKVTPETARLLHHWRHHDFHSVRPFFCQVEAVETAIWLAEVAPQLGKRGAEFLDHVERANLQANPELLRLALKLATGAGKTTVMAMIIAWQTINAVRHPTSSRFSRGFLVVVPNITIRDRLRVLLPNDPDSYYESRELVPHEFLGDLARAKIVITNYHAFKLRDRANLAKQTKEFLKGRGPDLQTTETEGQMIQRVMPELMNLKQIVVLNDEAHHCYRERPDSQFEQDARKLDSEEKEEAHDNNEAAQLWISGIEMVKAKMGVRSVIDLSATPFFLRGSGYAEGTLFPWTVSDFSLMDAIECGIVKLPRVPVADNIAHGEMPMFRVLWEKIRDKMPRKSRSRAQNLDPLSLPTELQTALTALYGHYVQTFEAWQAAEIRVPPVFIVVCNNTASSKLVYDYISGFRRTTEDGSTSFNAARLDLFSNFDMYGNPEPRPRTLLIDSHQLDSGDALDPQFREVAEAEIKIFKDQMIERTGNQSAGDSITDQDLLREVLNTVGKVDRLGEQIRCVVSVSMLSEGWDAQTVTHVLGVRAFGTQLLCEQVIGRALRRQSYDLNEQGLFNVEYADVLGIPFDFTAKPVVVKPQTPRETVRVHAVRPDRDYLELRAPRLAGYRVELPAEHLQAHFSPDSVLELTPDLVGPSITRNEGIIGEGVDLTVQHLNDIRQSTLLFNVTQHLLYTKFRDQGEEPKLHLFGQLKKITREWLEGGYLKCSGGTVPAQLMYKELADMACNKIVAAITKAELGRSPDTYPIRALLDAYNPVVSTHHVNFTTSKTLRWAASPQRCPINWVVCDSPWEAEFCRVVEAHPRVRAYVKNQGLGFEVPYLDGSTPRMYLPDFIVQIDDGHPDLLNLVVEIKGFRGENAKAKAETMHAYWIPAVNALGEFGRWRFVEFTDVFEIQTEFAHFVATLVAPKV